MEDNITRLFLSTKESILACNDRNQQIKSIQDFVVAVKFMSCKNVRAGTIPKGVISSCNLILSTLNESSIEDVKDTVDIWDHDHDDVDLDQYAGIDERLKAEHEENDRAWSEAGDIEFPDDVTVGGRTVKFEDDQ